MTTLRQLLQIADSCQTATEAARKLGASRERVGPHLALRPVLFAHKTFPARAFDKSCSQVPQTGW